LGHALERFGQFTSSGQIAACSPAAADARESGPGVPGGSGHGFQFLRARARLSVE